MLVLSKSFQAAQVVEKDTAKGHCKREILRTRENTGFATCITDLHFNFPISDLYSIKPVVLDFCISKVTLRSFGIEFTSSHLKPLLVEYPCNAWAKVCYMVSSSNTAETVLQATSTLALSRFLIEQQASLFAHTHPSDPTIKHLYHLSRMEHVSALQFESNYANNLHTICYVMV
ncbi:hypothetical protein AB4K20DRAFT_1869999 [Rhizopus microsporus]